MKDLSGDGKVTKKDVLIGRGVIPLLWRLGYLLGHRHPTYKNGYQYGGKVKGYTAGGGVMDVLGRSFKGSR